MLIVQHTSERIDRRACATKACSTFMARMAYSFVSPYMATVEDLPTPLHQRGTSFW